MYVSYRPIRLGLCVAQDSIEDFRKAVRLTSTLWGGKFNPIIPIRSNPELDRTLLHTFKVDALFAVSRTPEVLKFIEDIDYLPWPDIHLELFTLSMRGPLPALPDIYHPLRMLSEEVEKRLRASIAVSRPSPLTRVKAEGDPLADVILATLGDYPDSNLCPINYGEYADRFLGVQYVSIDSTNELPPDFWKRLSPLQVTEHGLLVHKAGGGWHRPGIFIGQPGSFSDLVAFWNLRAADVEVLFLPDPAPERVLTAAKNWMTEVRRFLRDKEPKLFDTPALWTNRDRDWALYDRMFDKGCSRHILSDGVWNGLNIQPPRVYFEQQSVLGTIDEGDQGIAVAFPLPTKPFFSSPETFFERAIATVSVLIDPKPTVGTFRWPYIPRLNEFYGRRVHFDYSRARVEPDGLGLIISLHESDLRLSGISPLVLITEVFHLAGIAAKQSAAGKVALRVIQHMGGLDSCRVFKIKGVRKLLHEFSLSKSFSHGQALARIGPGFEKHRKLFIEPRERRDLQPQDVFLHLVKRKVIRPGIELECSSCLLTEWHSLNDLAETATCPYCGSQFDSGPQLRDGAWLYRVSGLFGRTRDHEDALPVALALLQALNCLHTRGMVWVTGMDLRWKDNEQEVEGEIDLVVLTQNYNHVPELVVGECKTNMEVNAEQVDRLVAVAARFLNTGIKTFVIFAKAGGEFTERELELIDSRQTVDFNFILLTPAELEPYYPYENAQSPKIRHRTPLTLDEWAQYSSDLYLKTATRDVVNRRRNRAIS
jgi:hypothetical protein